jgi:anion-transporting  ArsA/GET3 family ATPase
LATETLGSLLERRLVIVTGKGGTGKTTVAAALAVAAARSGRRVLVAETGRDEQLPRLLAPGSPAVGYEGREVLPGITAMRIDPFAALAEYLSLQLGMRSLVDLVLRNRSFRQLMSAAPGWRDLITLGKVWHIEQMTDGDGEPRYDLIVVDAPATGHGVTFLDVPHVVVSAVRAGPLRRNAQRVEQMVVDPERTLLLPVALAEELPTRETAELVERLRANVGVAIDRAVVNGVFPAPFPEALPDLDERLAALPDAAPLGELPRPATLAACARHLRARFELNRGYVTEIGRLTGLPVVPLPYLAQGIEGPAEIEKLADALVEPPRSVTA